MMKLKSRRFGLLALPSHPRVIRVKHSPLPFTRVTFLILR